MKNLMLIIVLLLLSVQASNAQYSLMTKGQLCPFDTAVAVRIDTYRLETRKLNLGDTIINNLKQQLAINSQSMEALSTHVGRRTFIVNAIFLGIPPVVVMQWTGHKDYNSMKPYIAIVDELKNTEMNKFNKKSDI